MDIILLGGYQNNKEWIKIFLMTNMMHIFLPLDRIYAIICKFNLFPVVGMTNLELVVKFSEKMSHLGLEV